MVTIDGVGVNTGDRRPVTRIILLNCYQAKPMYLFNWPHIALGYVDFGQCWAKHAVLDYTGTLGIPRATWLRNVYGESMNVRVAIIFGLLLIFIFLLRS